MATQLVRSVAVGAAAPVVSAVANGRPLAAVASTATQVVGSAVARTAAPVASAVTTLEAQVLFAVALPHHQSFQGSSTGRLHYLDGRHCRGSSRLDCDPTGRLCHSAATAAEVVSPDRMTSTPSVSGPLPAPTKY